MKKSKAVLPTTNAPVPSDLGEVLADAQWTLEQLKAGTFDEYEGEFVAVYNKQVVAHDPKYRRAQQKAMKTMAGVPKERFTISYVDKLE